MDDKTKLIHYGRRAELQYGAVNPPILQTSTKLFPSLQEYFAADRDKSGEKAFPHAGISDSSYGITGTPTHFLLQELIAELEGGQFCWLTPSGLSAITTVLIALLEGGDHVLIPDTCYGPTRRFCNKTLKGYGVETTYYDPEIGEEIAELFQDNTKLLFLESPGSQTFEIQDIDALVKVAKKNGVVTAIDNSWASSLNFKPFKHGIDVSIQALTKYLAGHSDVLLGSIVANEVHSKSIDAAYRNLGISVGAFACYLALRGARTLDIRLQQHEASALKVAEWLEKRDDIDDVLYPALPSFKGHDLYKKYFNGANGLLTFVLKEKYSVEQLDKALKDNTLFGIGASWGGYESLILCFDPLLVRSVTADKWKDRGTCIRIHVGLENPEDLISELDQILKKLK